MMKFTAPNTPAPARPKEQKSEDVFSTPRIFRDVKKTDAIVMLQPEGLGEIIFCQGVAQDFISKGYKVYWPVEKSLYAGLRAAYPAIEWMYEDWYMRDDNMRNDLLNSKAAPLSKAHYFVPEIDPLIAKYAMYNLDWKRWKQDALMIQKDRGSEYVLSERFGITWDVKFSLVVGPIAIYQHPAVYMQKLDGIFWRDWCSLISLATEIHFPAKLEFLLLLELCDLRANDIHIYGDCSAWDFLMSKNFYIIH